MIRRLFTAVSVTFLLASVVNFALAKDITPLCKKAGIEGKALKSLSSVYDKAVKAGIPEEELYDFFTEIVEYGLGCSQLEEVLEKTIELKKKGLPFAPVFSKVREGMAKGMSPGMIVEVAGERAESIKWASGVIEILKSRGWEVKDYEGAVLLISTYIEKGYKPEEIVERLTNKGIKYAGFTGLDVFLGQGK